MIGTWNPDKHINNFVKNNEFFWSYDLYKGLTPTQMSVLTVRVKKLLISGELVACNKKGNSTQFMVLNFK